MLQELELVLQSCLPLELVTLTMTTMLMTLKTILNHNLNIYHISLICCLYYYLTYYSSHSFADKNKHFLYFLFSFMQIESFVTLFCWQVSKQSIFFYTRASSVNLFVGLFSLFLSKTRHTNLVQFAKQIFWKERQKKKEILCN